MNGVAHDQKSLKKKALEQSSGWKMVIGRFRGKIYAEQANLSNISFHFFPWEIDVLRGKHHLFHGILQFPPRLSLLHIESGLFLNNYQWLMINPARTIKAMFAMP
jgi:hypothetical protein